MKRSRIGMVGTAVGLLAFFVIGLAPLYEFSETMGRMLATVLFDRPLPETILTEIVIHGAIVINLIAFASFFMVAGGAVAGAAHYFLRVLRVVRRRARRMAALAA